MHLAIIMDGNRRYAKKNLIKTAMGHQAGVTALNRVMEWCPKYGVSTLTVYALSTENLIKRDATEINNLFKIFTNTIRSYKRKLIGKNVRVKVMGGIKNLPTQLCEAMDGLVESTKNGSELLLQICLNYGGRLEIIEAVNKAIRGGATQIDEQIITNNLYSNLEPDLILRPGGEKRMSNFLLWQSAYSEIHFLDSLWPDITEKEFALVINNYQNRERRFGK
jgi:undecaprenyl diphosphate synthase